MMQAPGSIDDRNGEFYCYACWEEYSHVGHDEPDVMLEMESVDSLKKEGSLHQFVREENHGTPGDASLEFQATCIRNHAVFLTFISCTILLVHMK